MYIYLSDCMIYVIKISTVLFLTSYSVSDNYEGLKNAYEQFNIVRLKEKIIT